LIQAVFACCVFRQAPALKQFEVSFVCTLWVVGRESLTMKMLAAPLTLVSAAALLVYTQSAHLPCLLMALVKFAGHVSL
jgi:hypothetical protein